MGSQNEIDLLIRARYPILYLITWEEKRALDELKYLAEKQPYYDEIAESAFGGTDSS